MRKALIVISFTLTFACSSTYKVKLIKTKLGLVYYKDEWRTVYGCSDESRIFRDGLKKSRGTCW